MYDLRLIRLLLLPSLFSGMLTVFLAALFVGYHTWLYVDEQKLFYNFLFGLYGLKTYIWQYSQSVTVWQGAFLGSPAAYYALVGAAATVVGLVVYFLLQLLSLALHGIGAGWTLLHVPGTASKAAVAELLARLGLRAVTLICWGLYAAFFFSTTLPFVVVLNRVGVDLIDTSKPIGLLYGFGAFIVLAILLHLHIVFMRLAFLRPRLIGGDRAIMEAEAEADSSHDATRNL